MRGEKLAQAYEGAHDVDAWTSQRVISKELLRREPEHEVGGEALAVSFDRLLENARLHAVERGEPKPRGDAGACAQPRSTRGLARLLLLEPQDEEQHDQHNQKNGPAVASTATPVLTGRKRSKFPVERVNLII